MSYAHRHDILCGLCWMVLSILGWFVAVMLVGLVYPNGGYKTLVLITARYNMQKGGHKGLLC